MTESNETSGTACCGPATSSCGCPPVGGDRSRFEQPFVLETLDTPSGPVPRVPTELTSADRMGTLRVRLGIARNDYKVHPGLYAVGHPDGSSPVLVSANYKLSFDVLRSELAGRDAWILVLDTDGVNVWCAAGKGTFGTDELVRQILDSGLDMLVDRRRVIVPQLGAPGVAAHEVRKRTGFAVRYGPIEARDLPAYLDARGKATEAMRRKTFDIRERAVLVPMEMGDAFKAGAAVALVLSLLSGLGGPAGYLTNVLTFGTTAILAVLFAIVAGAVLTPVLLPWLPGRAFAVKGVFAAMPLAAALAVGLVVVREPSAWATRFEIAAWLLLIPAIAAFLAMNFTGASTYTSFSGVIKEMRRAVPLQAGSAVVGLLLWISARWIV